MEFSRERGRKQGGHISEATFRDISFANLPNLSAGASRTDRCYEPARVLNRSADHDLVIGAT
jgi:hypothetical protein